MFENLNFSKSLDEDVFDMWLEQGRNSKFGYQYLLIIWDTWQEEFKPVYLEERDEIEEYRNSINASETAIAAYDLYSESKMSSF